MRVDCGSIVSCVLSEELATRFAHSLRQRLRDVFGDDPISGREWLLSLLGYQRSKDLLAGSQTPMAASEIDQIAQMLGLEATLLKCLFSSPSPEVLRHTLKLTVLDEPGVLSPDDCQICRDLDARVRACDQLAGSELDELTFELMDHLISGPDLDAADPMPFISQEEMHMIEALRDLPDSSRVRVMEAIERERRLLSDDTEPFGRMWRGLSEEPRGMLRRIADAPGLCLDQNAIAALAGLKPEGVALLEQEVLQEMARNPWHQGGGTPLTKDLVDGVIVYRLNRVWAAAVRAVSGLG